MEHAAIDIGALDRVVLDLGATGILVSHVSSAARARAMIEAAS